MADDEGTKYSDDELAALIARLTQIYAEAAVDLDRKFQRYMADFARKDAQKIQDRDAGLISDEEYKRWRLGQVLIGKRWREMADTLAADLVKVDQFAMAIVSDTSLDVFAVNHNYGTFEVEQGSLLNTSYTLYNRDTVARLVNETPELLPLPRVDIPKDLRWNREHLVSAVLQGIMQGESVGKIATRVQGVAEMDRRAALRNARTMVTCAQNSGRQAAYERGEKKGIHGVKQWVAAHDERVRASHAAIDGEQVETDKRFSNGLMYPGDKSGAPAEVYNCRCAMVYRVASVDLSAYVNNEPQAQMGYQQWVNKHEAEDARRAEAGDYGVNWPKFQSKECRDAISAITKNKRVTDAVYARAKWALDNRHGTDTEELYAVYGSGMNAGDEIGRIVDQHLRLGVTRTPEFNKKLEEADKTKNTIYLVHNHPNGTPPSISDLNTLVETDNASGFTFGHSGSAYFYTRPAEIIPQEEFNEWFGYYYGDLGDVAAHEKALEELSKRYGFSVIKLL